VVRGDPEHLPRHLIAAAEVADRKLDGLPISDRLWNGRQLRSPDRVDAPIVEVRGPQAVAQLLHAPGELGLARALAAGQIEIDGDLADVLGLRGR
jgi:cyclopropane-fatty-acyl-phospholipid synthase